MNLKNKKQGIDQSRKERRDGILDTRSGLDSKG